MLLLFAMLLVVVLLVLLAPLTLPWPLTSPRLTRKRRSSNLTSCERPRGRTRSGWG
jgi:hypothetical protein